MKIALVTFGSRGDVQPILALALALQNRGHTIQVTGPPEKISWAEQLGCAYVPMGADATAFIDGMPEATSLVSAIRFLRFVRGQMDLQFRSLPGLIRGADLVIGSSLAIALPSVADALGIPYRYITFAPQMLPSARHPFPAFKHQSGPPWFNILTWKIARAIDLLYMDRLINGYRRRLGAPPTPDSWQALLGRRVVVASDEAIATVPADARVSGVAQVGYLHLRQPPQRDRSLEEFLSRGPAPLYAGFGSMPIADQMRSTDIVVAAARKVGRRVMIAKVWDAPSRHADSKDVFFVRQFPHLDLFPHMAAIIHHGGAGTTATSAFSGVPQVVVPQILDQYYWGHRVHQAGLGARPIRRTKLRVRPLADAIQTVLGSDAIRRKASQTALSIRQTDSLSVAVDEVLTAA